jgi:aldose 1-epimerase
MNVHQEIFGMLPDGREAKLFIITNNKGMQIKVTNYGAIITAIKMPDKKGISENVACGFGTLEDYLHEAYLKNYPYFGSIIGRFGNRIAKGHLEIEGKNYPLAINNGPNHLHGGLAGFDKRLWDAKIIEKEDAAGIELSYYSPHLEENYPGNLKVTCIYLLTDANELVMDYFAETDQTTVINLTNHTYFNLTGGRENILDHELKLFASKMTSMNNQIPTGEIVSTVETVYDFSEFKSFNQELKELTYGYDDNFVLDNENGDLIPACILREKTSGRQVEIFTTQPGIQLYTGYWIPELVIEGEKKFGSFSGVALETQHYPDSVHHPHFPSVLLMPGDQYHEKTVCRFSVLKEY